MSEYGLTRLKGDAEPKRTRVPTAPIAALSRLTATSASVEVVEVAAAAGQRPAQQDVRSDAEPLVLDDVREVDRDRRRQGRRER